ncbi:energy transducer TonB [Chiayiivirga flava]|uniref:Protein TonB n=1 Tax=Chiayiivirga flava TaxID=659595 RepID=A0A7W8G283_9GAMM|nr:energy transducer TonB [Chiayiivirga flava]MBB5209678.1 protein TonB [Chiayiivirga flava]
MHRLTDRFAPSPVPSPSALRIGALSGAIALNLLAVFGLTLMQATLSAPVRRPPPSDPLVIDIVARPKPPLPLPPMPASPPRPVPRDVAPVPVPAPVVPVDAAWATDALPAAAQAAPADATPVAAPLSPPGAHDALTYLDAPPPTYPPLARRRGWQGEVILRVHVGLDGRPLAVEVERGSGHALLDRRAREHVLASWRFAPAQADGRAVEAWGRVPIRFALR